MFLGLFSNRLGAVVEQFWYGLGKLVEPCVDGFGPFRISYGIGWVPLGNSLGTVLEHFGTVWRL